MKSLLNRAKERFEKLTDDSPSSSYAPQPTPHPSSIRAPTSEDIFRYRYHHGTNLGSIFALERWLFPSLFSSSGESELAAVTASLASAGLDATKQRWQQHWDSALTDADIQFLVHEAKCTSIRLPIGYFTLGPSFCHGTPFEAAAPVYEFAWTAVQKVVHRANEAGIGVLLDLHGLPGGANKDMHSGTDSGSADLWARGHGGKRNREMAKQAALWVVKEATSMPGVVGVQIVNEAAGGAHGLHEWYEDVLGEIWRIDGSMPIYVSDAWDLDNTLRWVEGRKGKGGNPVVVDTHKYYTFSDADRAKAPGQIISEIPNELREMDRYAGSVVDHGAAQIIIGEYSCVLDGQTWSRSDPSEKANLVRQFGGVQSAKWQEKAGGAYFWTMKMEWMDGGEWGFVEQVKNGSIIAPPWLLLGAGEVQQRADAAEGPRREVCGQGLSSHVEYWNRTKPGKRFEHGWYEEGCNVGWEDAKSFWLARVNGAMGDIAKNAGGAERIGCLETWVWKRIAESGKRGEFVWEWEHGFRAGVKAFEGMVGI